MIIKIRSENRNIYLNIFVSSVVVHCRHPRNVSPRMKKILEMRRVSISKFSTSPVSLFLRLENYDRILIIRYETRAFDTFRPNDVLLSRIIFTFRA